MNERKPYFLQYEGVDLLYLDFRNINNEELVPFLNECKIFISKCQPGNVLFLVDVTNFKYGIKNIRDFTNFSRFNEKFSKATAIIGMTKEMQMLYNVALSLAGRDKSRVKTFSTELEAKQWLKGIIDKEKEEKKHIESED